MYKALLTCACACVSASFVHSVSISVRILAFAWHENPKLNGDEKETETAHDKLSIIFFHFNTKGANAFPVNANYRTTIERAAAAKKNRIFDRNYFEYPSYSSALAPTPSVCVNAP